MTTFIISIFILIVLFVVSFGVGFKIFLDELDR